MIAVTCNPWLVLLSLALATLDAYVAVGVAERVARSRGRAAALWTGLGALAMGSGVWAMHFAPPQPATAVGTLLAEAGASAESDACR